VVVMTLTVLLALLGVTFVVGSCLVLLITNLLDTFTSRTDESFWLHLKGVAFRWLALLTALALLIIVGIVLTKEARERKNVLSCKSNLRLIGVAMQNYYDAQKRFPPAYTTDAEGRPLLSWRLLLLPFFCRISLYDQFHIDEPWDSPHNRAILEKNYIPSEYVCPAERDVENVDERKTTSYVMIVGPDTIPSGPNSIRFKDVTDGVERTIWIVEVADSGIYWTEPRDLKAEEIDFGINDPERKGISSRHKGGAHVLMFDNKVAFLKDSSDPESVKALSTIAGGENVDEYLKQQETKPHWLDFLLNR
jgi:hypothetical protein